MKTLNDWVRDCYVNSKAHGFYDNWGKLKRMIPRHPAVFETAHQELADLYVAQKLALIHSEVSEALEEWRKGNHGKGKPAKGTFEDEIADVLIRVFDLCGFLNIDIEKQVMFKHEYNKKREYKHGKAF